MRWLNQVGQLLGWQVNEDPKDSIDKTAPVKPLSGIQGQIITVCVCGAPGVWKCQNDPDWQHVPGILLPLSDDRVGQWVGTTCPNCDRRRAAPESTVVLMQGKPGWLLLGRQ
jgi:hypothetical protein